MDWNLLYIEIEVMKKNVCENLLEILAGVGVNKIFGVTGDALNVLLEAIRKDDRFQLSTR